jgi:hypothetical protein
MHKMSGGKVSYSVIMADTQGAIVVKSQPCLFCGKETVHGLRIFSSCICNLCEQELLCTEAADPRYRQYVDKLKRVWPACEAGLTNG